MGFEFLLRKPRVIAMQDGFIARGVVARVPKQQCDHRAIFRTDLQHWNAVIHRAIRIRNLAAAGIVGRKGIIGAAVHGEAGAGVAVSQLGRRESCQSFADHFDQPVRDGRLIGSDLLRARGVSA